jgi:hypothetical protein
MSVSQFDGQEYSIQQLVVPLGVGIASNTSPSIAPVSGSLAQDATHPGSLYVGTGSAWQATSSASTPNVITGFTMTNSGGQPSLTNCSLVLQNLGSGTFAQTVFTLVLNQQITSNATGTFTWNSVNALFSVPYLPAIPINFPGVILEGAVQTAANLNVGVTGQLSLIVTIGSSPVTMTFSEISGIYT